MRGVTAFDDVELAALCSGDVERCYAFIAEKLGPIAAETADAHRLRQTLDAFFSTNCNYRAAAALLNVHHNTVRYRIGQASALLGGELEAQRLHLELALHLAPSLGLSSTEPRRDVLGLHQLEVEVMAHTST